LQICNFIALPKTKTSRICDAERQLRICSSKKSSLPAASNRTDFQVICRSLFSSASELSSTIKRECEKREVGENTESVSDLKMSGFQTVGCKTKFSGATRIGGNQSQAAKEFDPDRVTGSRDPEMVFAEENLRTSGSDSASASASHVPSVDRRDGYSSIGVSKLQRNRSGLRRHWSPLNCSGR
tara:strand:- start:40 stop:588 length:549 start_codon:yes stop_codon:yes gene_type:complete